MDQVTCPECGSCDVWPTTTEDAEGLCEYQCVDCGCYFVDDAIEGGQS